MQTASSQDQLNRIENRLNRLTQLVEKLIRKVDQDDNIFHKLVTSERFQKELQEDLELLKKDPSQFTDLYETYRKQKTQ
jgi:archaellum component FlaC